MTDLNQCTFALTGQTMKSQYYKQCFTCFPNDNMGACLNCISMCHNGHNIGPLMRGLFFCDCGDQRKCKDGEFRGPSKKQEPTTPNTTPTNEPTTPTNEPTTVPSTTTTLV